MAMIAGANVISQSSQHIDKLFWKNNKHDQKKARQKYFGERAGYLM